MNNFKGKPKYDRIDTEADIDSTTTVVTSHPRSRSGSFTSHLHRTAVKTPFSWRHVSLRFILLLLFSLLTVLVLVLLGDIAVPIGWQGISLIRNLHTQTPVTLSGITAASDAVDAVNARAIVAGQRECAPVLDAHGMPTGNFSYRSTMPDVVSANGKQQTEKSGTNFKHPLIVHYIRIVPLDEIDDEGGQLNKNATSGIFDLSWQLSRLQYLAVRSAWRVLLQAKQYDENNGNEPQSPDDEQPTIYLHSNVKPSGFYYEKLKSEGEIHLKWNFIEHKQYIGGRRIYTVEHVADFHKVNATYTFGGVHSDFDVLMVNGSSLRRLQNSAECFSSVDVNARSITPNSVASRHSFDFMLNCGLFSCVKQSEFLRIWRDNYLCDYRSTEWIYNSGFFPRLLFNTYKANPIALDWQTGMWWRAELFNETSESTNTPVVRKLQTEWMTYPGLHFYHVEHFKMIWDTLLRNSTSIFAQAMRLAQFDDSAVQNSSDVQWD